MVQEPLLLEVRHRIPHSGRRDPELEPLRHGPAPRRFRGVDIAPDDCLEDALFPFREQVSAHISLLLVYVDPFGNIFCLPPICVKQERRSAPRRIPRRGGRGVASRPGSIAPRPPCTPPTLDRPTTRPATPAPRSTPPVPAPLASGAPTTSVPARPRRPPPSPVNPRASAPRPTRFDTRPSLAGSTGAPAGGTSARSAPARDTPPPSSTPN